MSNSSADFRDLCARYWAFLCDESPIAALRAGVKPTHDVLLRESPDDHARRARIAAAMHAELRALPETALSVDERISARLLQRELMLLVDAVAVGAHWQPSIYPLGVEAMLNFFAQGTTLASLDDARAYNDRLETIPRALAGLQESLRAGVDAGVRYPKLVVERAVANVRGGASVAIDASPLFAPYRRKAGNAAFAEAADDCRGIVGRVVLPAIRGYADFVAATLGAVAQDSLSALDNPQGEAVYRHLVRQYTTLDRDPAEIHAFGLAEVERLKNEMIAVARSAGHADLPSFVEALKADPAQIAPSGDALREQIEVLSKRIDARLPEFFGRLPRTTYGVQSIPLAVAAGMPPAYAQPNPADGSSAGIHWLTPLPERCPAYMHLPLALHEAWPGHLMHIALMQEIEGLPEFRRHGALGYSACLEGWALYCEALGEDLGLYDTPAKRYGRFEMEMWRAVRLVVDTGLHWKRWSRGRALDFALAHMAMPQPTLEAEIDRYIGLPAQALSYQLGNQRFRELRTRAQQALGSAFRLRDFHDALMATGPVSLDVLSDVIGRWIDARVAVTRTPEALAG